MGIQQSENPHRFQRICVGITALLVALCVAEVIFTLS